MDRKNKGDIASPALYLAALALISVISMSFLKTADEQQLKSATE